MEAVFTHLSGPRRGETEHVASERFAIGSGEGCGVRFPPALRGMAGRHAEVFYENCEFYLRDLSGSGTFVNGHGIHEVILEDGDVVELGEGGPRLRFHVAYSEGEVCKPFRIVYEDSIKKAHRFGDKGLASTGTFLIEFARGIARDTSPATRLVVLGGVLLVGLSLILSTFVFLHAARSRTELENQIVQLRTQLAKDSHSRQELERDIAEERKRNAEQAARREAETTGHLETLRSAERILRERLEEAQTHAAEHAGELESLKEKLGRATRQLQGVERERSLGERIIRDYQAGIGFIEGAYRYYDAAGLPLRYESGEKAGEPAPGAETRYTTAGTGAIVEIGYTGTGFLVSTSGLLLTNRHVAEPWWGEKEASELAHKGLVPRFQYFRVYFPGVEIPVPLTVVKTSKKVDVALVKANLGNRKIPVLDIEREAGTAAGQPIILMGYPTGLDALLARLDEKLVTSIVADAEADPEAISRELSRRGMIRPLATQGHLSDLLPDQLVYDAQTTLGGSGGPIINARGKVIGVNFAVLSAFSGASFGVPIRYGLDLMEN